jgi:hypothetical protein
MFRCIIRNLGTLGQQVERSMPGCVLYILPLIAPPVGIVQG